VLIPFLIALFLFLAPVLDRTKHAAGKWLARERFLVNIIFVAVLLGQVSMIIIGQLLRGENWVFKWPW
jgi:hypothetical protein